MLQGILVFFKYGPSCVASLGSNEPYLYMSILRDNRPSVQSLSLIDNWWALYDTDVTKYHHSGSQATKVGRMDFGSKSFVIWNKDVFYLFI